MSLDQQQQSNFQHFIDVIRTNGEVWGLKAEDGWAVCPSIEFEETDVFPFFSDAKAAERLCSGDWAIYEPAMINLEEFLADWLPGMHEDNALVGPDWSEDEEGMDGLEIEPADVAAALAQP